MTATSNEEFERRARAGEPGAQYALAAIFAGRRQADLARHWLEKAAAQGHADAIFTLACHRLTATEGAADHRADAVAMLEQARDLGSIAALRSLAALTAAEFIGDDGWAGALRMMREACEREDPAALREVAVLALDSHPDNPDAEAMLSAAAAKDTFAAALISRRQHRGRATRAGSYSLDRAFEQIARPGDTGEGETLSTAPRVRAWRGAAGEDLCAHLIGAALPRLKREQVLGADGQRRTLAHRTAWGAMLGFGFADLPAVAAGRRMASLAGLPYPHGEPLSILRYLPGQEYKAHHDFLSPNDPDLGAHGQRLRTALLYLNDDYAGGETHFLTIDMRFAGRTGDVLAFDNVDAGGAPDFSVRHAGRPIERGEKWLASLWLRDRPFSG